MSDQPLFTEEQIANWRQYERVRKSGKFNMFEPIARAATGLERNDYLFCMDNYPELRLQAEGKAP